MKKLIKNKHIAYLIAIFCMFLWGSAFPTIKLTYQELNITNTDYFAMIYAAGIRFFLAGIFVLITMIFLDRKNIKQIITKSHYLLILGLSSVFFMYLFFYIGTGNTSGMQASILSSASTFLVVIFSHYAFEDEKFTPAKFTAIIMGLLGVIFTNLNQEFKLQFTLKSEGFILISSTLGALSTIFVKKYGNNISSFAKSAGQFLYGGLLLLVIGLLFTEVNFVFTLKSILLLLYGGFLSAAAFTLWYFILNEYKASEVAFLRLFIPFFGTFLSAIILGESIKLSIIFGLIFVIIGIVIVNKSKN